MKKTVFMAAMATVALGFSGLALAEHGDIPEPTVPTPSQYRQMQRGPGYMHGNRDGRGMQRGPQNQYGQQGPGYQGRGAGPNGNFYRGSRLPQEYRNRQYVVEDWRGHHLSAPPRGYHWRRDDRGDFLLVAIATGIIAEVLLH